MNDNEDEIHIDKNVIIMNWDIFNISLKAGLVTIVVIVFVVGMLSYRIYIYLPAKRERNRKSEIEKKKKLISDQYSMEKIYLTKYINRKTLLISEEYQTDFIARIANQMKSDLSFEKTTWTTTDDIDAVVEYYLNKSSLIEIGNNETDQDILNQRRELSKERLKVTRKGRKIKRTKVGIVWEKLENDEEKVAAIKSTGIRPAYSGSDSTYLMIFEKQRNNWIKMLEGWEELSEEDQKKLLLDTVYVKSEIENVGIEAIVEKIKKEYLLDIP